jgi:hypothetical protein
MHSMVRGELMLRHYGGRTTAEKRYCYEIEAGVRQQDELAHVQQKPLRGVACGSRPQAHVNVGLNNARC